MNARRAGGWLGRALEPPGVASVRAALAFGRDHKLSSPRMDWIIGYRAAIRLGLQYLPAGLTLDGLVVDVGAHRGGFTFAIRRLEPRARVLAIEPDERNRLAAAFAGDPNVTVDTRALSDRSGTATLHLAKQTDETSLLAPRADIEIASRVIETTTLDELAPGPVRLLKIDVQGHELAVLRGASRTLAITDVLLVEAQLASTYDGDSLFAAVDKFLRDAGFVLVGMTEAYRYSGRAVWADACYARP